MIKISKQDLDMLSSDASQSARKRKNYNFHEQDSDQLQRMLNALEHDTYVRPHKHVNPDKRETFILLRGRIAVIEFDDTGKITDHFILAHSLENYLAEITTGSWHTVISLEKNSVYYEIKDGPYDVNTDKVFADWSPEEYSEEQVQYLEKMKREIF